MADPPAPPPASPPLAPAPVSKRRLALWIVVTAAVVGLVLAVPLKIYPLKEKKAEAEAIPPRVHVQRPPQFGVASWYGDREAGRLTASGAVFDPRQLTAAHRTLPLGTEVRVTRLGTNETTTVIINDRGPYVRGRIIDLSVAAAEKLHMKPKGLARVKIEIVSMPTNTAAAKRAIKSLPKDQQRGLVAMPPANAPLPDKAKPDKPMPKGVEEIAEGIMRSP